jgi:hypothetical protein
MVQAPFRGGNHCNTRAMLATLTTIPNGLRRFRGSPLQQSCVSIPRQRPGTAANRVHRTVLSRACRGHRPELVEGAPDGVAMVTPAKMGLNRWEFRKRCKHLKATAAAPQVPGASCQGGQGARTRARVWGSVVGPGCERADAGPGGWLMEREWLRIRAVIANRKLQIANLERRSHGSADFRDAGTFFAPRHGGVGFEPGKRGRPNE